MKRIKTTTKRKIAGAVAILLIVTLLLSFVLPFFMMAVRAEEVIEKDFAVEAVIGFDSASKGFSGIVCRNSFNTFNINVKNNSGKTFKGYIQIPINVFDYNNKRYTNNYNSVLELAVDEEKLVSFSLPVITEQSVFEVNILNNNKKTLQINKFMVSNNDKPMVGVITDTGNYSYILSKINGVQEISAINLKAENFENTNYMSNVSVIIMDSYNTSKLTDSQKQALKDWINNDGVLILGLGNQVNEADLGFILNNLEGQVSIPVTDEFEGVYQYTNYENIASKIYKLGNGYVSINKIVFSDENKAGFKNIIGVISRIFDESDGLLPDNDNNKDSFDTLNRYRGLYYSEEDEFSHLIFIGLYIYAIGIGFVLYFVLKKKNKKDLAIKIIPATAVGATVIIFVLSLGSDYNKPLIIGNMQIDASQLTQEVEGKFMVTSPKKNKVEVNINKSAQILNITGERYNYYIDNDDIESIETYSDINVDENKVEILSPEVWQKNFVNVKMPVTLEGKLENNVEYVAGNIKGYVTNNTGYTLKDCYIGCITNGNELKFYYVQELENGAIYNLGNAGDKMYTGYIYNAFDNDIDMYDNLSAISKRRCELTESFLGNKNTSDDYSAQFFVVGFADAMENPVSLDNKKARDNSEIMLYSVENQRDIDYYYE